MAASAAMTEEELRGESTSDLPELVRSLAPDGRLPVGESPGATKRERRLAVGGARPEGRQTLLKTI